MCPANDGIHGPAPVPPLKWPRRESEQKKRDERRGRKRRAPREGNERRPRDGGIDEYA